MSAFEKMYHQSVGTADRTAATEHIRVIKSWKFPHEIASLEACETSEPQSKMLPMPVFLEQEGQPNADELYLLKQKTCRLVLKQL